MSDAEKVLRGIADGGPIDDTMLPYYAQDILAELERLRTENQVLADKLRMFEAGRNPTAETWECPRCHRINTIWETSCACPPETFTTTSDNTGGDDD